MDWKNFAKGETTSHASNNGEQSPKKRGGCLKGILIAFGILILISACGALFTDTDNTADEETANVETTNEDTSTDEDVAEEPQEREGIVETDEEDENNEPKDVITIAKEHDYVSDASLIEELYAAQIDGEVQNFNPEGEKHYRIQLEHHGGFTGSKNLDRFKELVEDITAENAEYDYLVLEAIREEDGELERLDYTRLNPEQAQALTESDEANDEIFEEIADFHIHGLTDTNVGLNENIIGVNEEINFAEFTVTVDDIVIEDEEAEINMTFKNDSDPSALRFISALGMDVYQGDTLLDETSGEVEDGMGGNSGIYYQHETGIESTIDLTYKLISEDEPIRIVFTPLLYDFEDSEEVTIELK